MNAFELTLTQLQSTQNPVAIIHNLSETICGKTYTTHYLIIPDGVLRAIVFTFLDTTEGMKLFEVRSLQMNFKTAISDFSDRVLKTPFATLTVSNG